MNRLKNTKGRQAKPLRFVELESGCYVCLSHILNKDGYLRISWNLGEQQGNKLEFFHRTIWQHFNGTIPDGHEIDHMCNTRACCNPKHLRCLPRTDHLIHTNKTRYHERHEAAKVYWLKHKPTGTRLGQIFDVSFSAACGWIRNWKKESKK